MIKSLDKYCDVYLCLSGTNSTAHIYMKVLEICCIWFYLVLIFRSELLML